MVVTTVVVVSAHGLCQILDVGDLPAGRGVGKIRRELAELIGGAGVAFRRGLLGGGLKVRGDLLRHLLVLGRIGLLKLLQFT